jgi:hypothetical protein
MLAERPTPTRVRPRRTQVQAEPSGPRETSPKKRDKKSSKGRAAEKRSGKGVPQGKAKRRQKRIEVDDPVEVKRAHAGRSLRTKTAPQRVVAEPARRPAQRIETAHALVGPAKTGTAAAERVDGFGAEGATLNQTGVPVVDPDELVVSADALAQKAQRVPATAAQEELLRPATRAELAEEAVQPVVLPGLYRHGRLVMPLPLKGSHDVLVHQNTMADAEGLDRIEDDDKLDDMRAAHLLVDLPVSASLRVNPGLPADRRCARPWAVKFAVDTGRAFAARFRQPLEVTSAVRTVDYQLQLQRVNGNAAAVDGDGASPHLTGQALDFGKRGMSKAQIAWMRAYLLPLMRAGKIDVEEEFKQACFHVSVYRSYAPVVKKPRTVVAQLKAAPVVRGEQQRP